MKVKEILEKNNFDLNDVVSLLETENLSDDYFYLLKKSNEYARAHFNKGYIFTQIGLNSEPCSGNCRFCSMGRDNFLVDDLWSMSKEELVQRLKNVSSFVSDVFLMTTADYDPDQFLEYCKIAREVLPKSTRLVANFADFDLDYAKKLKEAGVVACYHIRRLREGIDTDISVDVRENTIKAIKESGLELYYCIEPIGKEHSYEEIAKEILYARDLDIDVMAVMRRVDVNKGYSEKNITLLEVTKIVAIAMLVVKPKRSMNVHEPNEMSLLAGVNQLYSEEGGNPRDIIKDTSIGRGISAAKAKRLLWESNWNI